MATFQDCCGGFYVAVKGIPRPQGSMTAIPRRGGGVYMKSPDTLKMWRSKCVATFKEKLHNGNCSGFPVGPLTADLLFVFPRPSNHSQKRRDNDANVKYTQPDLDKLVRAVFDALTQSGVIGDDNQVARLHASKQYPNEVFTNPGVFGLITQVDGGWVTAADRKKLEGK